MLKSVNIWKAILISILIVAVTSVILALIGGVVLTSPIILIGYLIKPVQKKPAPNNPKKTTILPFKKFSLNG